ncbi:NAD(P)H-dependent oxidoreductase [Cupriavidus basilensis]
MLPAPTILRLTVPCAQWLKAQVVVPGAAVYKATPGGLRKPFLDLLPQTGLRDKVVLPIATGGSLAHALAIDYALRPVLSAGFAPDLPGIFAVDQQIEISESQPARFDGALTLRLEEGVLRVREGAGRSRIDIPA